MSDERRVRYLSLEWIDALTEAVGASDGMRAVAAELQIGITQVVTDGPEGDVIYHLQLADAAATFGAGPAYPEDLRFEQDWETAIGVATSVKNAQEAFITGRIRITGDKQRLIDSEPVFHQLDAVFSRVRQFTDYE